MGQGRARVSCYTLLYLLRNMGSGRKPRILAEDLGVSEDTVRKWSDVEKADQRGWPYCIKPEQLQELFERYTVLLYGGDRTAAAGDLLFELDMLGIEAEPYRRRYEEDGFPALIRELIRAARMCRKAVPDLPREETAPEQTAGEALALEVLAPAMAWQLSAGAERTPLLESEAADLLARELSRLREEGALDWLLPAVLPKGREGTAERAPTRTVRGSASREERRHDVQRCLESLVEREVLRRNGDGSISFRGDAQVRLAARYLAIYGDALSRHREELERKGRLSGMPEIDLGQAGDAVLARMLELRFGKTSLRGREQETRAEAARVPASFQKAVEELCPQVRAELQEGRAGVLYEAIFLLQCDEYGWHTPEREAVRPLLETVREGLFPRGQTCRKRPPKACRRMLSPQKQAYLRRVLEEAGTWE